MAVYKFRVTFEDHDDIYREIEIKSNRNFEELHNSIQKSISFDSIKDASFFISDDQWRKGEEIRLKNENENGNGKNSKPIKLMKDAKLASFIDDPHQKFLYVYDPAAHWSFLVELVKILSDDPKVEYPRCSKSVGIAPKQYKLKTVPPPIAEEDDDHPAGPEKIFHAEEAYDTHDEDEDSLTEGDEEEAAEEGEEFGDNEHHEE